LPSDPSPPEELICSDASEEVLLLSDSSELLGTSRESSSEESESELLSESPDLELELLWAWELRESWGNGLLAALCWRPEELLFYVLLSQAESPDSWRSFWSLLPEESPEDTLPESTEESSVAESDPELLSLRETGPEELGREPVKTADLFWRRLPEEEVRLLWFSRDVLDLFTLSSERCSLLGTEFTEERESAPSVFAPLLLTPDSVLDSLFVRSLSWEESLSLLFLLLLTSSEEPSVKEESLLTWRLPSRHSPRESSTFRSPPLLSVHSDTEEKDAELSAEMPDWFICK
jgi:hypothetical protein